MPDDDSPYIEWANFWSNDPTDHNWLYEPILAYGRGHAIYAKKKQGKSLFMLSLAAHLTTAYENYVVIYLDYEMTKDDIYERLEDMGYNEESDLSRLRYILLPTLPSLDSEAGGQALMHLVDVEISKNPTKHVIVIIDTFGRAVVDPENSADTTRKFYRFTGLPLKKRGVTYARLDHAGKDEHKEQRGSSAKADDVDIVWKVAQRPNGDLVLSLDVARMSWVPAEVYLIRQNEPLAFDVKRETLPPVVEALVMELDLLDVPSQCSVRECRIIVNKANIKASTDALTQAVRTRKQRRHTFQQSDDPPRYTPGTPSQVHDEPEDE